MFKRGEIKTLNARGAEYMGRWIATCDKSFTVKEGDKVMVMEDDLNPYCTHLSRNPKKTDYLWSNKNAHYRWSLNEECFIKEQS